MRPSLMASVVSASLLLSGSAVAAQFIPKINVPESYKDVQFGLSEMRENIEGVECGGWTNLSDATVVNGATSCRPVITCVGGIQSCEGNAGFTYPKEPNGDVPICLSNLDATGRQWDYVLMHELVHAKQFCSKAPGEPLATTRTECCSAEREAYTTSCGAMAADGLFENPVNGITLTAVGCIAAWSNVSCSGYGPYACSREVFPPGYIDALLTSVTNSPATTTSCQNLVSNPPSRVQSILDTIKKISDAAEGAVIGNVPVPRFSAVNPDGSEDTVTLPGRGNSDPLGAPSSGLGERGGFEYPDSAFGFRSACDVTSTDMNPMQWCMRGEKMEKATPTWCKKLFDAIKQMGADIDAAGRPMIGDPDCPVPEKYCFDYTSECRGQDCRTRDAPSFSYTPPVCHIDPDTGAVIEDEPEIIDDVQASFYRHYAGNFMEPGITVTAPGSDNTWNVRAECYEYYKEFDPKTVVTSKEDEQCEFVIATDGEQTPKKPEWFGENEQKQPPKRDEGPEAGADVDITREPDRDNRNVPDPWIADTETNLTMIDMKKLKEQQKKFDDPTDITAILGTLITTRQTGSKTVPKNARTDQFDDSDERKMAIYLEAQQRELLKMTADPQTRLIMPARFLVGLADDDPLFQYVSQTVSRSDGMVEITLKAGLEDIGNVLKSFQRIFVAPIQEVRIPVLVPLASVTEIDARIADWKLWKQDTLTESLKLTTRAAVSDPVASAVLLAQASALQEMSTKADPLIVKLEQYRDHVEKTRLMRGALLTYLQKLYDSQKKIREYFADWYEENSELLLASQERAVERRELKRIWRLLQRAMLQTDACQMYWCSNQRYSAPVYSLLDDWWGDVEAGESRDRGYQPPQSLTDLEYEQPKDQLFDFSDVKFPSEPWLIPTLWPVQVRVNLPTPPLVGVMPSTVDNFPDLPELPDEKIFEDFPVPEVTLPDKSLIRPPETSDLEAAKIILRNFRTMIDGTDIDTQINEEAALAAGESIDGGDDNFPLDRESMRGAYCRFPPSILIPPDSNDDRHFSDSARVDHSDTNDEKGNPAKIIHVESDLRERLARLFSRWMPNRDEDFAGRVVRRNAEMPEECHEDVVCYFLPPEKSTVTTWQWFMPDSRGGNFTYAAARIRENSLPEEDQNPYINASRTTLERIFPNLDLPIITKLTVPRVP